MAHPAHDAAAADSFELLADVSHHGASFFELFAPDAHVASLRAPPSLPPAPPTVVSAVPLIPPLRCEASLCASSSTPPAAPPALHAPRNAVKRHAPPAALATCTPSKRRKPRASRAASSASLSAKRHHRTHTSHASLPPSVSQQKHNQQQQQQQQPLSNGASHPTQSNSSNPLVKDTHNSHTRKCRAKVNTKFQQLLSILPTPPANTGIKHKAQILDYTIRVFRDIHARKTLLEAELALSSRRQLNAWVNTTVSRSLSIQDVLGPYLSLICTKGAWKYSEAWVPHQHPTPNNTNHSHFQAETGESRLLTPSNMLLGPATKLRLGLAVIPSLGNTDDPHLHSKLERFRDRSRPYTCKARFDLPGRIMCTMRPEWLPSLQDHEAFQRAKLAGDASLVICFGVPVFIRGHVAAVAIFFDTDQRPYDAKCVDLAVEVADLLGNTYGASAIKRASIR